MKLRIIGTDAERARLVQKLHGHIRHTNKPQFKPETGLYSVYFDVNTATKNPPDTSDTK